MFVNNFNDDTLTWKQKHDDDVRNASIMMFKKKTSVKIPLLNLDDSAIVSLSFSY